MGDISIGSVQAPLEYDNGMLWKADIVVRDANNDGVFNEGDRVCLSFATMGSDCDPTRVNNAMKQLGVSRPYRGVQINAYGGYFEFLRQARMAASKGDDQTAWRMIRNALEYARSTGLSVDTDKANEIGDQAHARAILIGRNPLIRVFTPEGATRYSLRDFAKLENSTPSRILDKMIDGYVSFYASRIRRDPESGRRALAEEFSQDLEIDVALAVVLLAPALIYIGRTELYGQALAD